MSNASPVTAGSALPMLSAMPLIDFAAYGEVETVELSRAQKIAGGFLARNWAQIPHVTHHDEVELDALEACRRDYGEATGQKMSLLPWLAKALVAALREFPQFNASLDPASGKLVLKRYFHIGVAVDTPKGLIVPVVRDCDRKPIATIASEVSDKSARARGRGIPFEEMTGGCMTISSLGGIGGTGFTPIINAPEVAILGVTRTATRLKLVDGQVVQSSVLPLSLSYDHRVINGADAARFLRYLGERIASPATLID